MVHAFFFFNDTATTEIYTLSLHDALPICSAAVAPPPGAGTLAASCSRNVSMVSVRKRGPPGWARSEEHTSELQSRQYLVCRLLLEKKTNARCEKALRRSNYS